MADGNYSQVNDIIWGRASTLIWLNYPFLTVFSRAIFRTVKRIIFNEKLFAGNRETLKRTIFDPNAIPYWVVKTHWRRQKEYPRLFKKPEFAHLQIIELGNQAQADEWIERYCMGMRASGANSQVPVPKK
ncbi:hypothetical protein ACFL35_09620 [Candidatus Riflebacteria bacterium]